MLAMLQQRASLLVVLLDEGRVALPLAEHVLKDFSGDDFAGGIQAIRN